MMDSQVSPAVMLPATGPAILRLGNRLELAGERTSPLCALCASAVNEQTTEARRTRRARKQKNGNWLTDTRFKKWLKQ